MAMGTPIATFYRAKSAEFSAENALFDMQLMATQLGTTKKVATTSDKVTAPAMEQFSSENPTYTLKHTPKAAPSEIYALNGDSTFGTKYTKSTDVSNTSFAYANGVITLPKNLPAGTELFVMYEYDTDSAVEVVNNATQFPVGCKFVMEILGCDVCDQTNKRAA